MKTKQQIRELVRSRIKGLDNLEKEQRQNEICTQIMKIIHDRGFRTVALYSALKDEADIFTPLINCKEITILLPSLDGDRMVFRKFNGSFQEGAYHIYEATGEIISIEKIDAIFCPGRAFTMDGIRLGRGGGFYDRYLENIPDSTALFGVCFKEQIFKNIPNDSWDKKMNKIIYG